MSEHMNGKLKTVDAGSTTEFDIDTETGWTVATAGRSYARRLAAAWNVCEGIDTESLETGATLADICERANGYQFKLNAARALLREVIADTGIVSHIDACQRAQEYLDACDKPGEPT